MTEALRLLLLLSASVQQFALAQQEIARAIELARSEGRDVSPEELAAIAAQTDAIAASTKARLQSLIS